MFVVWIKGNLANVLEQRRNDEQTCMITCDGIWKPSVNCRLKCVYSIKTPSMLKSFIGFSHSKKWQVGACF